MRTEARASWPIAVRSAGARALIGIPERLGDGSLPQPSTFGAFPTLEEIAGEDWRAEVIRVLAPDTAAWAWRTRAAVVKSSGIETLPMPPQVDLSKATKSLLRQRFLSRLALVIVPAGDKSAQQRVLEWTGIDTERDPDFILTARQDLGVWDPTPIERWCDQRGAWARADTLNDLPVDRAIVVFDGDLFCALGSADAEGALEGVRGLAATWGRGRSAGLRTASCWTREFRCGQHWSGRPQP